MGLSQLARASTAMAFLNPLLAMLIPAAHPSMHTRAMNVQQAGNLGRGVSIGAEQEGLQAQRDARGLVGLGFLAQGQELAARAGVGLDKDRFQVNICCVTNARRVRPRRPARKKKRGKGHHRIETKSRKTAWDGRARLFWQVTHCPCNGLTLFAEHPGKSILTFGHEKEQISFSSAHG